MIKLKWIEDEVPKGVKVTQVYGVVFTEDGRTLLKSEYKNGELVYSLAGGTPEDFDNSTEETLRREFIEEVNTTLKNEVYYLGYQEVDECDGSPKYAQIRMTALIDNIGNKQPDPDNGKTYDRVLVGAKKAIELLDWKATGEGIINSAVTVAKKYFNINIYDGDEIIEV